MKIIKAFITVVFVLAAIPAYADPQKLLDISGFVEKRVNAHKQLRERAGCVIDLRAAPTKYPAFEGHTWIRVGLEELSLYGGFPVGSPIRFDGGGEVGWSFLKGETDEGDIVLTASFGHESRHKIDAGPEGSYTTTWLGLSVQKEEKIGKLPLKIEGQYREFVKSDANTITNTQVPVEVCSEDGGCVDEIGYSYGWAKSDYPKRSLNVKISSKIGRFVPYGQVELVQTHRGIESTPKAYLNGEAGLKVFVFKDVFADLRYTYERRPEDSMDLSYIRSTPSVAVGVVF